MPNFIPPALLASSHAVPSGPGWGFERKYDGYRTQIAIDSRGRATIRTRTGIDWTARFPGLVAELEQHHLPAVVLDGELIAKDQHGRSDFRLLCRQLHHHAEASHFVAFDILSQGSERVTHLPLSRRRKLLAAVLGETPSGTISTSPIFNDGEGLLEKVRSEGGEGVVAKRLSSVYRPGERMRDWRKIKLKGREDFVIVGWNPALDGTLKSIAVATELNGELRFRGFVGSGFAVCERHTLPQRLAPLSTGTPDLVIAGVRAPSTTRWVRAELHAEVQFDAVAGDGVLRGAAYLGLREDLSF